MQNLDLSIQGLPLKFAFEQAGSMSTTEDYVKEVSWKSANIMGQVVMTMGEDARDFIINLIPFVLRINVEIVYVDEKNRGAQEMQNQLFQSNTEDFKFSLDDGLDMHDQTIYLFLKTGHYDIIYKTEGFKEITKLSKYDDELNEMLQRHKDD